ncbi:MAG: porin family protein [Prevotellaceae bacterium]|jgi:hypothetical protein|nr:porin family protein [Prevotellaceae bacterium]
MKKILTIVLAFVVAGSAFAQEKKFYLGLSGVQIGVGGMESTGLGTGVIYQKTDDNHSSILFGIAPEFGYFITERFAVGLGAGFNYKSDKVGDNSTGTTIWGVSPYARFYPIKAERFGLYLQAGVSFLSSKHENASKASNMFYAGIRPGVSYNLSDSFAIHATFGDLGFWDLPGDQSIFGLNLNTSTLLFGITIAF